ncbi:MAG: dihydrofolate reductase [Nakamurella sp.]
MTMILAASVAPNGVIGVDGELAWRNSADLRRLKASTMGHTLIMGRKNYESIGRPLPGRRTVVLTRQRGWTVPGVIVVHDAAAELDAALDEIVAETGDDIFYVFGGGEIYRELLPRVDVLELTEIHAELRGDVYFPSVDYQQWTEVSRNPQDGFSWVRYQRIQSVD